MIKFKHFYARNSFIIKLLSLALIKNDNIFITNTSASIQKPSAIQLNV